MINLLPPDVKDGYKYARRNVVLRRWVVIFLIALIGLGGLSTYGVLSIHQSTVNYSKKIGDTESAFQKESYTNTQKQVQDMSNNFKLVLKVLGQEVLFSQLLQRIGATIPSNANLTGLTIAQVQGGIDISANATDYATATQVQVNLADPDNKIFSKADIVNIACNASSQDERYPCTVNIRALFSPNNPFLFINSKATP